MRAEPNLEGELPRLITKLWLDLSSQPPAVTAALARRWGTQPTVAALWFHACAEAAAAWRAGDAEARAARWSEIVDQQREAALVPPPGELEVIAQLATSYVEGRFPRREARERVAAALAALIGGSYQSVLASGEDSPAGDVEPDMTTQPVTTVYCIVPVTAPHDRYAAGYDGNNFESRAAAEADIPKLSEVLGTEEEHWTVREFSDPSARGGG